MIMEKHCYCCGKNYGTDTGFRYCPYCGSELGTIGGVEAAIKDIRTLYENFYDNHVFSTDKELETYVNSVKMAENALNLVGDSKWTLVEDELPPQNHAVLVYCAYHNNIYTCIYYGEEGWYHFSNECSEELFEVPTAWMPIPNYIKSEKEKEDKYEKCGGF